MRPEFAARRLRHDGHLRGGTFTVTNVGSQPATAMADGGTLGDGFSYGSGFAYPGSGGSCGPTLAAGASCFIAIVFQPPSPGSHASALTVIYDDGAGARSARRDLHRHRRHGRAAQHPRLAGRGGRWRQQPAALRLRQRRRRDRPHVQRHERRHADSDSIAPASASAAGSRSRAAAIRTGGSCTGSLAAARAVTSS